MDYLNFLLVPIYWILFKIQKRLTRVETQLEMRNGCIKKEEKKR